MIKEACFIATSNIDLNFPLITKPELIWTLIYLYWLYQKNEPNSKTSNCLFYMADFALLISK